MLYFHALPCGDGCAGGISSPCWRGKVGNEIGPRLAHLSLKMLIQKSKTRFAEDVWRPLGHQRGALLAVLAMRQGRVAGHGKNCQARMHIGGGEKLGRQSMLGPALTGDSSWWQAPPLLGGECLPFVSWPVNSLSPYLTSSICS